MVLLLGIGAAFCASAATISTSKKNGYTWSYVQEGTTVKLVYNTNDGWPCAVVTASSAPASGDLVVPQTLANMSVVEVSVDAFKNCAGLTSVSFPQTLTAIQAAFAGCPALTNVTFAADTLTLYDNAFDAADTPVLTSFATTSSKFAIEDGALYNAAKTKLVRCPPGRTNLTCQAELTTFGNTAFEGASALQALTFLGDVPENFVTYREGFSTSTLRDLRETIIIYYPESHQPAWVTALKQAGFIHYKPLSSVKRGLAVILR